MPRKPTGQVYENKGKRGTTWGLRFRLSDGRRVYEKVGQDYGPDPIDRKEAEARVERLLAQVRLGQYRTKEERAADRAAREAEKESPLFADFAEKWYERRCLLGGRTGQGLSDSARTDLRNQLNQHLLPWFAGLRLSEIDVEEVERYAAAKRQEGRIGARYINKTLASLRSIMRDAVRYGRVDRNPAEDVRLSVPRFNGSFLDSADQIVALLDAASKVDRRMRRRHPHCRALLATLTFAGLRIDEALSLRWEDVNLAGEKLRVRKSKTEAGERTIKLAPILRQELADLKARRDPDRTALVFETSRGGKDSASNVRRRILAEAAAIADKALREKDNGEMPERLTPHSLRRTYASILVALGHDPRHVMGQMGHTDPTLTLRVYAREMARDDVERAQLRALWDGSPVEVGATAASGDGTPGFHPHTLTEAC